MSGRRDITHKVKTARGRKNSSTRWLQRQLNDPYVQQAKAEGYRSRAAYKLMELDEKFGLLKPGMTVLDLGAAPGGWSQVVAEKMGKKGRIVGIDLLPVEPLAGAEFAIMDFTDDDAPERLLAMLAGETIQHSPLEGESQGASEAPSDWVGGDDADDEALSPHASPRHFVPGSAAPPQGGSRKIHLVLSDMAANTTGHAPTDHLRIMMLCEMAYDFAKQVLAPGGAFVCKVLQGGTENSLLKMMQKDFKTVKHAKPAASRKDSAEQYVVAMGFRG